jgi:hypothetical protein
MLSIELGKHLFRDLSVELLFKKPASRPQTVGSQRFKGFLRRQVRQLLRSEVSSTKKLLLLQWLELLPAGLIEVGNLVDLPQRYFQQSSYLWTS